MGHAVTLTQIARSLLGRGHEVDLVWRELGAAVATLGAMLQHPRLRLWAAPVWRGLSSPDMPDPPRSHADLLCFSGYLDVAALTAQVKAWQDMLQTLKPDVLVTDHAPGALLAAKARPGLRTAQVGNGYFQPPRLSPLPSFRFWDPSPPDPAFDAAVLASCQAAQNACGITPVRHLTEMLNTDLDALLTWPELHPYGDSATAEQTFFGPLPSPDMGAPAIWPAAIAGRRCLAYVKTTHPGIESILDVLIEAQTPTLLVLSGATPAQTRRLSVHAHIQLSRDLINMNEAMSQADFIACQGNSGTVMSALSRGKPLLMLPGHTEQWLNAYRACELQVGVALQPDEIRTHGVVALHAVRDDTHFSGHALTQAKRHPMAQAQANLMTLSDALEALLHV